MPMEEYEGITVCIAHRLQCFKKEGSMGVVKDTQYIHCFWPNLDEPTAIFAEGSGGIRVMGWPYPRNVIFPKDTEFCSLYLDALYPAEQAVRTAWPGISGLINLTPEQATVWIEAYEDAVAKLPPTAAIYEHQEEKP